MPHECFGHGLVSWRRKMWKVLGKTSAQLVPNGKQFFLGVLFKTPCAGNNTAATWKHDSFSPPRFPSGISGKLSLWGGLVFGPTPRNYPPRLPLIVCVLATRQLQHRHFPVNVFQGQYYVMYAMVPCFMLSALTVIVFLIPPEAGEKVSLSITVMLSFTVFMLAVADSMPQTSNHTPVLGTPSTPLFFIQTGICNASTTACKCGGPAGHTTCKKKISCLWTKNGQWQQLCSRVFNWARRQDISAHSGARRIQNYFVGLFPSANARCRVAQSFKHIHAFLCTVVLFVRKRNHCLTERLPIWFGVMEWCPDGAKSFWLFIHQWSCLTDWVSADNISTSLQLCISLLRWELRCFLWWQQSWCCSCTTGMN